MSDQAQHTRGPWTINGNVVCFNSGFEYRPVCKLLPCSGGEGTEHAYTHREGNEANARLIAAAPDLLQELKNARESLREITNCVQDGWFDAAEDWARANASAIDSSLSEVIAKAEGRTE